jgi:hypothetical protein
MGALDAKDWNALESTAIGLVFVLCGILIGVAIRRRRKGEPIILKGDVSKFLESAGFFIAIILAMPLSEIVERKTGSAAAGLSVYFLLFLLLVLPSIWLSQRRMAINASAHGVDNPAGLTKVPDVRSSPEEKRLGWYMVGSLLIVAVAMIGIAAATTYWAINPIENLGTPNGEPWRLWAALVVLLFLPGLLLYAIVGRWPGRVSNQGDIEIAATAEQIWEKLTYSAGMEDWKGIYHRIERLDEPGEVYRLHYLAHVECAECGLPKHPDDTSISQRVEILEATAPHVYRTRSFARGVDPFKGDTAKWLDCEEGCYTITPLPRGGCTVHLECAAERPKFWMGLLIKFGGPVTQSLGTLKAHLEGGSDNTIYATARARISAARLAPRHCGCAKPSAASGLSQA